MGSIAVATTAAATTTTAAAVFATSATTATTTASPGAIFAGLGHVHRQGATTQISAVKPVMACWASSGVLMVTNAKPRGGSSCGPSSGWFP